MLKAFNPVAILLISWATRLKEPNRKIGIIVFAISSGVALASKGELRFDLVGFLIQAVAVAVRDPARGVDAGSSAWRGRSLGQG